MGIRQKKKETTLWSLGVRENIPIMENQMDKTMESEMQTGVI